MAPVTPPARRLQLRVLVARTSWVFAAWMLCGCGKSESLPEPFRPMPDVAPQVGIVFDLDRAETPTWFMPESMTPGCALFDADGDGDLDVFVVSPFRRPDGTLDPVRGRHRLWLQEEPGVFRDATEGAGLDHQAYGMGVAVGDPDRDGDWDLYVTAYGPDAYFRNDGHGRFREVSAEVGLSNVAWGSSAGFCDLDGDGWTDLFVVNYVDYDPEKHPGRDGAGRPEYVGPERIPGVPDRLFRNRGDGTFEDVSAVSGIGARAGKGLGLVFLDLNGDGPVDVYVANDREANFAWIQQGDGTFVESGLATNLAFNSDGKPEASMGVAVGDADGDGAPEILVTHLVTETHTLYRWRGDGRWQDMTAEAGLSASTRNDTGWGVAFADLDLDGDQDLVWANGRVLRGAGGGSYWDAYGQSNRVFENNGAGVFTSASWPDLTTGSDSARGLICADWNRDGRLDVLVATANGKVRMHENRRDPVGRPVRVQLRQPGGAEPEGAWVVAQFGTRRQGAHVGRVTSYLVSSVPEAVFSVLPGEKIEAFEVRWPDGVLERFPGAETPSSSVVLERGSGR